MPTGEPSTGGGGLVDPYALAGFGGGAGNGVGQFGLGGGGNGIGQNGSGVGPGQLFVGMNCFSVVICPFYVFL